MGSLFLLLSFLFPPLCFATGKDPQSAVILKPKQGVVFPKKRIIPKTIPAAKIIPAKRPVVTKLLSVTVPTLKCKSVSEATSILKKRGLTIKNKGYQLSRTCNNKVISQSPRSGTRVRRGGSIVVTLGSAPLTTSIVPNTAINLTRVKKGTVLTFSAKTNYRNARLIWKLDSKPLARSKQRLVVKTNGLSVGVHHLTLEASITHKGLRNQKVIARKSFSIIPSLIVNNQIPKAGSGVGKPKPKPPIIILPAPAPAPAHLPPKPASSTTHDQERIRIQAQLEAQRAREEAKRKADAIARQKAKEKARQRAIENRRIAQVKAAEAKKKAERIKLQEQQKAAEAKKKAERIKQQARLKAIKEREAREKQEKEAEAQVVTPPITDVIIKEHQVDQQNTAAIDEEATEASGGAEPPSAMEPPVASAIETPTTPTKGTSKEDQHYGKILYNPPSQMTLNKSERVEVRIGWDEVSTEGLIGTGEVQEETIPVTTFMTVKLCCGKPEEDHPFDITPINTNARQIIDPTGFTQWSFRVIPRKSGEQYLNLLVSAQYIYPNGDKGVKDIPVISKVIKVEVDSEAEIKNWFIRNWKWIGGFLIVPLLLLYLIRSLNQRKKKRRKFTGDVNVFISYRRDDSSGYTLALYKQLSETYGSENIFMDLDDIPHGSDFVATIEAVLSKAQIVLVMIGEDWLNASNAQGRRLDNPNDFVRLEVATALDRDIRVIPVLLKNAKMPSEDELPDVLKKLARRNAIQIHDDQFEESVNKLIEAIADGN